MQLVTMIFSIISALSILWLLLRRKPGFNVLSAQIIKTKHALPVLSITVSFKGMPASYINPMIYIKSGSSLYKTNIFSGSRREDIDKTGFVRETPDEIKLHKTLPHSLGVFTMNVFYPTEIKSVNKTYLYVTTKKAKLKKFKLRYKIK